MSLLLAGLSALLYGAADFLGGFSSNRNSALSVVIVSQKNEVFVALVGLLLSPAALPSGQDILWGLAAGLSGAVGLLVLYYGIAKSIVSIVSPLSALLSSMIPLAFGLALGERPSAAALAGAGLCLPAVVLLSMGGSGNHEDAAAPGNSGAGSPKSTRAGGRVGEALLLGLAAGIGFGFFFVAIARTSAACGLWPVCISRGSSLLLLLCIAGLRREKISIARPTLALTLLGGASDMGANIAFLYASRTGLLTLASIISSLYPVPTVLLGCVVFKEKIPLPRAVGLALAVAGAALISLR